MIPTSAKWHIAIGDCRTVLAALPDGMAQTCVTSPPYFGLRDYGNPAQIGLEKTPDAYVAEMVAVFREVRRVLSDDGTLWLNLGDSYAGAASPGSHRAGSGGGDGRGIDERGQRNRNGLARVEGVASKNLLGIPWRVAFALQADGWILRSDVIWHKPNPMPESVTDRPTKAHEYVFLFARSPRYFYDAKAIEEPATDRERETRNRRTVWTVASQPFSGAHFATMPPDLVDPCVLAGSRPGDVVLDPFAGAGTTGLVALKHQRRFFGVELNPTYAIIARNRIVDDSPLLNVGGVK